jgi:hypothetical protein
MNKRLPNKRKARAAFDLDHAIAVAGHQHDFGVLVRFEDLHGHFDAAHDRHDDIGQDQANLIPQIDKALEPRHAIFCDDGPQTGARHCHRTGAQHDVFVVANEDDILPGRIKPRSPLGVSQGNGRDVWTVRHPRRVCGRLGSRVNLNSQA